jgi:hypothetical protein
LNRFLEDVWRYCELFWSGGEISEEQEELTDTPLDIILKNRKNEDCSNTHVTVDLTATDEQITNDFKHWLTKYRQVIGHKSRETNFTDNDLREWVKYRVLPYFDLMLVLKLEGKSITQAQAARLIFPDEYDVDITERLRRTTKQKADNLFNHSAVVAMQVQLSA